MRGNLQEGPALGDYDPNLPHDSAIVDGNITANHPLTLYLGGITCRRLVHTPLLLRRSSSAGSQVGAIRAALRAESPARPEDRPALLAGPGPAAGTDGQSPASTSVGSAPSTSGGRESHSRQGDTEVHPSGRTASTAMTLAPALSSAPVGPDGYISLTPETGEVFACPGEPWLCGV
jgi:hypothetical protein